MGIMTGSIGGGIPKFQREGQHEEQCSIASGLMCDLVSAANMIKEQGTFRAMAPEPGETLAVGVVLPVDARAALSIPGVTCFGVMDESGGRIYHSAETAQDIERLIRSGLTLQEVIERVDATQYKGVGGIDDVAGALIRIARCRARDVPNERRSALERHLVNLQVARGLNADILSAACRKAIEEDGATVEKFDF